MARPSLPKISPRSSDGVWQRVRLARVFGLIVSRAIATRHAMGGRAAFPPVASGRPALLRARAFVASEA
jgi:hypothetical protein